jgi:hypothetical protein
VVGQTVPVVGRRPTQPYLDDATNEECSILSLFNLFSGIFLEFAGFKLVVVLHSRLRVRNSVIDLIEIFLKLFIR